MSKVITLAGQLGQGKDVVSDRLAERLNERGRSGRWVRASFANAVKGVYQDAFGVDRDFVEKWKRISEPPPGMLKNVRQSLQFIGDGFRQIKGDIWIDIALRGDEQKIISDSRYLNEAKAVQKMGGFNILLWRPGFENDDPNPSESEIRQYVDWCVRTEQDGYIFYPEYQWGLYEPPPGLENYHYFLRNDGDIEALYNKIEKLLPVLEQKFGG